MAEQYLAPTSPGDHARTTNHHESPDETALSNDIDVDTTTTTATISEPLHELLDHFQATITAGLEARRLDFLYAPTRSRSRPLSLLLNSRSSLVPRTILRSFENQATELMQQLQHEIGRAHV